MPSHLLIKIIPVTLMLKCSCLIISAQDNCSAILKAAQSQYEGGSIEDIPQMLTPCMKQGFSDSERLKAHKLIILSYIFDHNQEEANKQMLQFRNEYPAYKIKSMDPAEFGQLFNSFHLVPVASLGFSAGGNLTFPVALQGFATNSQGEHGKYSNLTIGGQGGFLFSFYITNRLSLSIQSHLAINQIKYTLKEASVDSISSTETQNNLEFPLSILYDFGNGRFSPYIRIGGSIDYMVSATANYKLVSIRNNQTKSDDIDIYAGRRQLNYNGILGGGIKYKVTKGYLFIDVRWNEGLMNQTKAADRFHTIGNFKYPGDDFRLRRLDISIGYAHVYYKAKKKK